MDFETRSWLSVGWRPVDIPTNCRLFPDLAATSLLTDGGTNESVKNAGYRRFFNFITLVRLNTNKVIRNIAIIIFYY